MKFDPETTNFEAVIELDLAINKPTLIHAHVDSTQEYSWYPHGVNIDIQSINSNQVVNATTQFVGNELQVSFD
jgi:hypothetical protein